jgi:sigma-E factor negative regulatory protein RseB
MFHLSALTALVLFLFTTASSAENLFDTLQRISEAGENQNYQGIFILRKSSNLSTLRITHGSDDSGVWESLEALNGEPKKVIRRNNTIISIFPERELILVRKNTNENINENTKQQSLHSPLPENWDQLGSFYSIKRLPDDRIADHQTLVIHLLPNDDFRYGYRYWIDKNTGMLLRCDLVDGGEKVIEQMMFTSLDYLPNSPVSSFDLKQFDNYQQQKQDESGVEIKDSSALEWAVKMLPKGFMLTQHTLRYPHPSNRVEGEKPDLLHLVYSDGLASVSIFIRKNEGAEKNMLGASAMGAVNAYGYLIDGYSVTAVGEVPVATVQAMARSVIKVPHNTQQQ